MPKKRGKKFRDAAGKIDREKLHAAGEACTLICETSPVKFDATVEIHVCTATNPKHADQIVRATVVLPHGTGKSKRIAVFCDDAQEAAAKKAGADVVGGEDLIEQVAKGKAEFDVAIAQPALMKSLAKVAKILGPRGLMPSPKSGTVTDEIGKAVEEIKKGKVEFRNDKAGIVHSVLGKVSFGPEKIKENFQAFLEALQNAKPAGCKGSFVKKVFLATSMGPAVGVDL